MIVRVVTGYVSEIEFRSCTALLTNSILVIVQVLLKHPVATQETVVVLPIILFKVQASQKLCIEFTSFGFFACPRVCISHGRVDICHSCFWRPQDIAQQANRHRMEAPESASGIVAVGGVGEEGPNWWIDREGLLQTWGQQNGTSHEGIQYPGHTPNAGFADMVLSTTSDRLVSVARLTERSNPFRASTATMLEFCVWELSSGKMLYRWERASETAARVSLVSGGKQMIWVNETQAILCDLDGGNARVLKNGNQDIAAVEIAVHPSDGNVIALIGDKGEVWIVDLLFDARVIQFNRDWAFEVADVHLLKAA